MRIGIDTHGAERLGEGNATYTRNLLEALLAEEEGDEFVVFAGDPGHAFYRSLPARTRVDVVGVRQGHGLARLSWTLGSAARAHRVDVLHVQYAAPLAYRGPLVVTVHDLGFLHVPDSFRLTERWALGRLVPWSVARATRVITDSHFSLADIRARYGVPAARVSAIGLAAAARFRPLPAADVRATLARHGLDPGYVFSLGRLNRRKNLGRLMAAHARLAAAGAAPPLVIGGKPDYGLPDAIREPVPGASVRWTGLIPDDDLPAFYAGARCFVYPSLFEGFGLPVLEAMACGVPVVAAAGSALPELVGDAGLLVDPERVDAIAEGLRCVLGDAGLARDLARRGLERSHRYSWRATADATRQVYREAVEEWSARRSA
jgi:alpha-1,3-rhamnosyl/mannosyltransferase